MKKYLFILCTLLTFLLVACSLSKGSSVSKTDLTVLAERQIELIELWESYDEHLSIEEKYEKLNDSLGKDYFTFYEQYERWGFTESAMQYYHGIDVDYWRKWLDNLPEDLPEDVREGLAETGSSVINESTEWWKANTDRYLEETIPDFVGADYLLKTIDVKDYFLNGASWEEEMDSKTLETEFERVMSFRHDWLTDKEIEFFDQLEYNSDDYRYQGAYVNDEGDYLMKIRLHFKDDVAEGESGYSYRAIFVIVKTREGIDLLHKNIYVFPLS